MKKDGFTLVELLAVIVILAIVLAIAIPGIAGIVKSATKGAFKSDARMVLKQLEYEKLKNESFDPTDINKDNINDLLELSNQNYSSLNITLENNNLTVAIVGKK